MSKNKEKHSQGYWKAVGISARRIVDDQTVTVDGGAGTVNITSCIPEKQPIAEISLSWSLPVGLATRKELHP